MVVVSLALFYIRLNILAVCDSKLSKRRAVSLLQLSYLLHQIWLGRSRQIYCRFRFFSLYFD